MASSWKQSMVKCPFYLKDNGINTVVCEGLTDGTDLAVRFAKGERFNLFIATKCGRDFEKCPLYEAIERKYD